MARPIGAYSRALTLALGTVTLASLPIWYGSGVPGLAELAVDRPPTWSTAILDGIVPLAERTASRERWELYYMYGVSVTGVVWTVGRVFQGWRFDREQLTFVPRTRHRTVRAVWQDARAPSASERESDRERYVDRTDDG
ncbi:hypothetical protein D8Y22_08005 [Salinadaptatus halalkaliphilus]|uniref:Uncharacterized protein n=1 Tax=Salinadaptatus halalkaliphilus TaxID=2419781 RepID=A0A4V6RUD5_9EURY|nr:hypothetical protein [Salinadaptatus halalkaliphilus]THE65157.1 hypothetical protein D8Y22_08005 [Salinadaptatus halalkaliphilus]